MKALLSGAVGGPETLSLEYRPDPVPDAGEVLVAVKACSVNFPDALMLRDMYQFKPQRPFAPGSEVAGVVEAVGDRVTAWSPGDRVIGLTGFGGMAEKVVVDERKLVDLPHEVPFEVGASLLLTYGTTIYALKDRAQLKAGETLLVLGAAGGVGLAAVELGKAFGARVVTAVSSEEKAEAAREAGADEVLIYGRAPFDKDQSRALAEAFKAACGPAGAQVVYDIVGGDYSEPALRAIGWEGRFLVVGFPAGIARLPLNLTLLKSCDIRGVFLGAFVERNPGRYAELVDELLDMIADGRIAPRISQVFPLERGGDAIAALEARSAIGKLVVRMGD